MANSYTYDAENNLLSVDGGSTALYQYGAMNERLFGAWNNQYQRWGVDLYNRRSTSFFNGSLSVNEVQFYAGNQKHAYWLNNDNNFHFESTDWLGTVRLRTNAYGTVEGSYGSLPFGDGFTESGSDDNLLHYTGFDADVAPSVGLGHATYREYGNVAGRWTSPDPYTGSYDFTDPQSLNRYVYALNNPLAYVDPLGYSPEDGTSEQGPPSPQTGYVYTMVITSTLIQLQQLGDVTTVNTSFMDFLRNVGPTGGGANFGGGSGGSGGGGSSNGPVPAPSKNDLTPPNPCLYQGNAMSPQTYSKLGAIASTNPGVFLGVSTIGFARIPGISFLNAQPAAHGNGLQRAAYGNYAYGAYMASAGVPYGVMMSAANTFALTSKYTAKNGPIDSVYSNLPQANVTNITSGYNAQRSGTLCHR